MQVSHYPAYPFPRFAISQICRYPCLPKLIFRITQVSHYPDFPFSNLPFVRFSIIHFPDFSFPSLRSPDFPFLDFRIPLVLHSSDFFPKLPILKLYHSLDQPFPRFATPRISHSLNFYAPNFPLLWSSIPRISHSTIRRFGHFYVPIGRLPGIFGFLFPNFSNFGKSKIAEALCSLGPLITQLILVCMSIILCSTITLNV